MDPIRVVLFTDSESVESAVTMGIPKPNVVECRTIVSLRERYAVSSPLEPLDLGSPIDAVFMDWRMDHAPVLGNLAHQIRREQAVPVIALCGGAQEIIIAALSSGADDVSGFPLYLPMLQARIAAYRRLVDSLNRRVASRVRRRLKRSRKRVLDDAVEWSSEMTGDGADEATIDLVSRASEHLVGSVATDLDGMIGIDATEPVQMGVLRLDPASRRVFVGHTELDLTPKEYALLGYLVKHVGQARSRDEILDAVWGISFDTGTNMVDVYMHFVRKKLESAGLSNAIRTLRGHGYRLEIQPVIQ